MLDYKRLAIRYLKVAAYSAIDLNWDKCLYGNRRLKFGRCDIPQYVIKLMIKSGFNWGGHWRTLKDYMHFELR